MVSQNDQISLSLSLSLSLPVSLFQRNLSLVTTHHSQGLNDVVFILLFLVLVFGFKDAHFRTMLHNNNMIC